MGTIADWYLKSKNQFLACYQVRSQSHDSYFWHSPATYHSLWLRCMKHKFFPCLLGESSMYYVQLSFTFRSFLLKVSSFGIVIHRQQLIAVSNSLHGLKCSHRVPTVKNSCYLPFFKNRIMISERLTEFTKTEWWRIDRIVIPDHILPRDGQRNQP